LAPAGIQEGNYYMKSLTFNFWELQYLQQTLNRWYDYKGNGAGGGTFSDAERSLVQSIKKKVQVVDGTPVIFNADENNFLQSILYMGQQDYGRGSGGSVFETGVRGQVQRRTVQINADILAKLRNALPPIINPGETESLES
jgi:hypothetical protein